MKEVWLSIYNVISNDKYDTDEIDELIDGLWQATKEAII